MNKKQDGRFVAMVTKDLQTLNLKFDQVMFNSLVLMWERNFDVTFGIFSVLEFQISVLENYLDIYLFYIVLQKYAHIGLKQNLPRSTTLDIITRLRDNAAFVCVHLVGRFSEDFSEVRGLRSRGFML